MLLIFDANVHLEGICIIPIYNTYTFKFIHIMCIVFSLNYTYDVNLFWLIIHNILRNSFRLNLDYTLYVLIMSNLFMYIKRVICVG